jgi:succinate dehydrogenase / fumarate reductase cytochrome b subunit
MIYRGQEGMYAWLLHRISGIAILVFLMAHIVDTALVAFGPDVYNAVMSIYHNPVARVGEALLVAGVIYHALNGLRVILIDFWGEAVRVQRQLWWAAFVLSVLLTLPAAYIMLKPVFFGA